MKSLFQPKRSQSENDDLVIIPPKKSKTIEKSRHPPTTILKNIPKPPSFSPLFFAKNPVPAKKPAATTRLLPKTLVPKIALESTPPQLSTEQQDIYDQILIRQQSVFFTGSAGTGKSFLLRSVIKALKLKYGRDAVAVTASTGIAACNINGSTLHSFAGVGFGTGTDEKLFKVVRGNTKSWARWIATRILVIDESKICLTYKIVSMVDGDFFDRLERLATAIKGRPNFGGIQLVLCGDFLQLPPVSRDPKFCFESESWNACVPHIYHVG